MALRNDDIRMNGAVKIASVRIRIRIHNVDLNLKKVTNKVRCTAFTTFRQVLLEFMRKLKK